VISRVVHGGFVDYVEGTVADRPPYRPRRAHRQRLASYLLVSDRAAVKHFEIRAEPEILDHRALILDL
jgi:hypothetical protein